MEWAGDVNLFSFLYLLFFSIAKFWVVLPDTYPDAHLVIILILAV